MNITKDKLSHMSESESNDQVATVCITEDAVSKPSDRIDNKYEQFVRLCNRSSMLLISHQ